MVTGKVTVAAPVGLHARPAADLVRAIELSGHEVYISNEDGRKVPGASILGVLSLAAKQGQTIEIEVSGPAEVSVLASLISVVRSAKDI